MPSLTMTLKAGLGTVDTEFPLVDVQNALGRRRRGSHGRAAPRTLLRARAYDGPGSQHQGANQDALDSGEHHEWHLVGASDVVPGQGVILFWDTARPGFGRTSR